MALSCRKALGELIVLVSDGKEKALMALFGKCMKQLKGNCDPQLLRTMLIDEINKA